MGGVLQCTSQHGSIVLPCQPGLILGTHAHFSMGKWKGELEHVWQYHAATQSKSPSAIKNEMEEWRIQLLHLQFLFLTAWPVMDVRLICKSRGNDYPPEIPCHITKVLQLDIVLKTLAEDVKHRVNGSWVADYSRVQEGEETQD
ncbi:hypothetical protein L1049_002741 [Liquidambar formosana]|uniref:Uncharacterized protein n=1 Tax=Liquidambar formosana TaxID=63359 RepID=A0AAP0R7N6_LIQFO